MHPDLFSRENEGKTQVLLVLPGMVPCSCAVYVVKSQVLGLQRAPENSELAPSILVLSLHLQKEVRSSYIFSRVRKNQIKMAPR